jgi:hypothetical protein
MYFGQEDYSWTPWTQDNLPIEDGGSKSFWPHVYDRLLNGNDAVIRTVTVGVGGTTSGDWATRLYSRFQYASKLPKVDYVFWAQGE